MVSVVISNRTRDEINVPVVPAFVLKPPAPTEEPLRTELSYVALWDLAKGAVLHPSSAVPLKLEPGDSKKIAVDLSTLLWSRINWSVLPHDKLSVAVPAGKYSLYMQLTGKDGETLCSSKSVDVLIK
jgi:hypothetical protein